jgi:DNA-nicking Smr family endonuclease
MSNQVFDLDEKLFVDLMIEQGVERIEERPEPHPKIRPTSGAAFDETESKDALMQLRDFVEGKAPLSYTDSDEFVAAKTQDCSYELFNKLAQGEISYQSIIDLHGLTKEEAKERVKSFFSDVFKKKQRCVLVITGRGLGSPGKKSVLKEAMADWLSKGFLRKGVLAYTSAPQNLGGVGAFLVLLKKDHKPFWMLS